MSVWVGTLKGVPLRRNSAARSKERREGEAEREG